MDPVAYSASLAAISAADIESELLTLNANVNAAMCRFLVLIREFGKREGWYGLAFGKGGSTREAMSAA